MTFYKVDNTISRYPQTKRITKLLTSQEFADYGDSDPEGISYADAYTFWEHMDILKEKVWYPYLRKFGSAENSEFSDTTWWWAKNCYLTICAGEDIENILYSFYVITKCTNVLNSVWVTNWSQNIYEGVGIVQSFAIFFSKNIINSANIWFCSNLQWCHECLLCDGLINRSYCIQNQDYTKEEYMKKKEQLLGQKEQFMLWYSNVSKSWSQLRCIDSTWAFLTDCEQVQNGLFVQWVKLGKNLIVIGNGDPIEHCYDNITSATRAEHSYANMWCSPAQQVYCNMNGGWAWSYDLYYTMYCLNSHHLLWCIWLKNKSYCIFNKQYTKEERHEKVDEIFAKMEKTPHPNPLLAGEGENALWAFFPGWMNPFYFNDTAAYLIDPSFTKEEVEAQWYLRRDEPIKVDIPEWMETVKTTELDQFEWYRDEQRRIDSTILKKVIIDEQGNSYRVIKMEYDFLMKYGLPLPRKHWLERMKENFRIW